MGLLVYQDTVDLNPVSIDRSFSNPFKIVIDGRREQTIYKQIFIGVDPKGKSYTGISLSFSNPGSDPIVAANGFSWKLYSGSLCPTEGEWATISENNTISIGSLGSNSFNRTFLPVWVRIYSPANQFVDSYVSFRLNISATES
jgi:hypothetical protein